MLFNSWDFAVFLAIVLALYYCLNRRGQNVMLLCASYVFYGWWDARYLILIITSTLVNYLVSLGLGATKDERRRRLLLFAGVSTSLGILAAFKYFNFFADSLFKVFAAFGMELDAPTLHVLLPVGISFYTFQTLSYTIDVYRGEMEPTRDLLSFALYVSYFPQLVAGPIERAKRLLPQVQSKRSVTDYQVLSGLVLMLVGFVKKIAIADFVSGQVNRIFADPASHSSADLLVGVYSFTLLIYCDFSGYSDIARGVSRLFGIEIMVNFRQPYFSSNVREFWRRWHISLSTWLRDYLYISLGGNRRGTWKTYRNLFLTMLLGGLWHGANWTFVIWGALHGVFLGIHRAIEPLLNRFGEARGKVFRITYHLAAVLLTFHLVVLAWVFFRCDSFSQACRYLAGLFSLRPGVLLQPLHTLVTAVLLVAFIDIPDSIRRARRMNLSKSNPILLGAYAACLVVILLVFGDKYDAPFVYFQF